MNCHSLAAALMVTGLLCLLMPGAVAAEPLWTHPASTSGELSGVVISADGSTVVAGGDQLVSLSRDGMKRWTGWSGTRLVISSDGNRLLTLRDQTIRMIDGTGTMLWSDSLGVPVSDIDMTPDASLVLAGGGSRVRVMNGTGTGFRYNHTIYVSRLRFLSGGNDIVFVSKLGVQRSNLTLLMEWEDLNVTQDMVEAPDGGSFFVTVTNNRVRKYTADGEYLWDSRLPGGNALGFALSGDGSTIVVGRDDNTLMVLDTDGNVLWSDKAANWITSVAVSRDGNTIAAGSIDRTLLVYDRAGNRLGSFTAKYPFRARSVAVSVDGSLIAATDGSAVYGFSRDQFTLPAPPAPSPMVVTETTGSPPPAATTAASSPAVPATATPKAAPAAGVALLSPGILLLLRQRKP
jgi:WD40 repeat protein